MNLCKSAMVWLVVFNIFYLPQSLQIFRFSGWLVDIFQFGVTTNQMVVVISPLIITSLEQPVTGLQCPGATAGASTGGAARKPTDPLVNCGFLRGSLLFGEGFCGHWPRPESYWLLKEVVVFGIEGFFIVHGYAQLVYLSPLVVVLQFSRCSLPPLDEHAHAHNRMLNMPTSMAFQDYSFELPIRNVSPK